MHLTQENNSFQLSTQAYQLTFQADRPYARLLPSGCANAVNLFYLSGVHSLEGSEDTPAIGNWQVEEETDQRVVLKLNASSSRWDQKVYRFRCLPDRLEYEIEVFGTGTITQIDYLSGYFSGNLRWGSGFFWSGQQFIRGFNPEPGTNEEYTFASSSSSKIDLSGVPLPGRADWFFTPPPFCFGFDLGSHWLGVGIQAAAGQNQYTRYQYHGMHDSFYLSLDLDGHLPVNGHARLPVLGFDFGVNEYDALAKHANALRSQGLAPTTQKIPRPTWWQGPIFCGWGAQCHLANQAGGRAPDFARQDVYESFAASLEEHGLHPAVLVIDDKWQKTYGENAVDKEKWSDLPRFIRACHAKRQKVLLWLKAWDPEGLPKEECICNAAGIPVALDPTQPDCAARMRSAIRTMLSDDEYGADGFKIDFTARIPNGPGMRSHSGAWGLELMRSYLEVINRKAKLVKPDALIIAHTPHPYLADLVDMVRLNDINTGADVVRQMTHRAKIAKIACPNALIDTDNWPMKDLAAWRSYLPVQPTLGVPALYIDRAIDSTGEILEESDYEQLRAIWKSRSWIE